MQEQIAGLKASQNDQIAALNKEIAAIPGQVEINNLDERIKKLTDEKASLGIFKGKEKKALQAQIDDLNGKLSDAKKAKDVAVAPINESMAKLQARISEIDTELTKDR